MNMKLSIRNLVTIILIFGSLSVFSQNSDPVILTIGKDKIKKSEFINIYKKNNQTTNTDQKSLEEYMELFINFKLKVMEAQELGLDTLTSFTTELEGYRKQLAQPYLVDKDVSEALMQEAYSHLKSDIRASHVLIKLKPNAPPADTLIAYKKIMDIRKRLLAGEDFAKVASELSDDPSARDQKATESRPFVKGNGGDLGYFTAFDMVYPFECAAFETKLGDISAPFRTDYGYHIMKVTDKKEAMGKIQVAHILVLVPADSSSEFLNKMKLRIDSAYAKIKSGSKWEDIVNEYSDDKGSAPKGGTLPWFGVNRMVPDFIAAISKLKEKGDISVPFKTQYGWHIIKLIDRKPIGAFDDVKSDLKVKITRDQRSNKSKESLVAKVKVEAQFKEIPYAKEAFYKVVTDSVFANKWKLEEASSLKGDLFIIGNKTYTQPDFANYLYKNQGKKGETIPEHVDASYKSFVDDACIAYEDNHLSDKYSEFKSLMKEYREGILLFDLTDQKVWSKAIKDSIGLENFYNKNKAQYMWTDRIDASLYTCANDDIAKKTRKLVEKAAKKNWSDKDISDEINKNAPKNLKITSGKYTKTDNATIDKFEWKVGISDNIKQDSSILFINIRKILAPEPKSLVDAKGLITADYQNFLEKEWIAQLRSKYPIVVNKEVLNSIK
ncbi:MAG: peptidylprolyl isomerase [Bacteroidota bacterium]